MRFVVKIEVMNQTTALMRTCMTYVQRLGWVIGCSFFACVSSLDVMPAQAADPSPLVLPDGLEASLVASEPLLSSPSDIDVDAHGRIWVCEVVNYRGKKNTRPEGDRILVLEDTTGDGKADHQTVFHQGRDIDSALGICVIGEGPGRKVIVSCAPNVFIFYDDDGDLKADRRESLFTKIGRPQHDHSVHAFVVGPDGRWYFNFGNTGQAVHDCDGKPVLDRFGNTVVDNSHPYRQGMVFRCRPDGTDFEVLGHNFRNNYEVTVDSFGTLWQSDNDDDGNRGVRINWVMEYGNYGYKDEVTGASWQTPRTNMEPDSPERHWHLNDPGVVPNLLQTGNGSPTGICVYEGSLLPERFHGSVIHCDAGPNVVRAYHISPDGAGYAADVEVLVDGAADKWFRPSDVCVAPDGSLIIADWHDPGVGGHGMGDTEKGRIYRIAPKGVSLANIHPDLSSIGGLVASLASPNLSLRATALEKLTASPEEAATALEKAFQGETNLSVKARLAWAIGMLPGRATQMVDRLIKHEHADMRCVAIRMCRLTHGDIVSCVEHVLNDSSPSVRREAAIALRGISGKRADQAWAVLASHHTAGDRWETEALGIGADAVTGFGESGLWNARLAAWKNQCGDACGSQAGRDIVWRSRSAQTPQWLCTLIGDPRTTTSESLALVRALDFQERRSVQNQILHSVTTFRLPEEKRTVILPELVLRLEPQVIKGEGISAIIEEAIGYVHGTKQYVDIIKRFQRRGHVPDLLAMAAHAETPEDLAVSAASAAVMLADAAVLRDAVLATDTTAMPRLLAALGTQSSKRPQQFLESLIRDASIPISLQAAAVLGLGRSESGAKRLIGLSQEGVLTGSLPQAAATAIVLSPWKDIKAEARETLPMPVPKGGGDLPTIQDLTRRGRGNPARGKEVFFGRGTCSKCHRIGNEGKVVGPDLSEIGSKLSRVALYESILAPSAAISHNFESYTAVLNDGRSFTGLLISRNPINVIIRGPDGIDVTLEADLIDELIQQPVSLMPADLATTITRDDFVNLVSWLETLRK